MNKKIAKDYENYRRLLHAYQHALTLVSLDLSTKTTPAEGIEYNYDTQAILATEYHKITTSNLRKKLLKKMKEDPELTDEDKRVLFLEEKGLRESLLLSKKLVKEISLLQSKAETIWEKAREKNKYNLFAPYLKKIVAMQKKVALLTNEEMVKERGYYATFLNDFEENISIKELDDFFNTLKSELVPFISQVVKKQLTYNKKLDTTLWDIEKQKIVSKKVIELLELDEKYYTLKESAHPFSTNIGQNDLRFTTHYHEDQLFSNIYSVIHEAGHSIYEHQIDSKYEYSILGSGVSMGVHESQSRFYENILGRSLPFVTKLHQILMEVFPNEMDGITVDDVYKKVNAAKLSLIRIDADELTYPLHIIIRYEMEKLIVENEDLDFKDLPSIWNAKVKEYLNIDVPNDSVGILQDVHWSSLSFGYFPTYALGSAYGAMIYEHMKDSVSLDSNTSKISQYLKEKIHKYGSLYEPSKLFEVSFKERFNVKYFVKYLKEKYSKLYQL